MVARPNTPPEPTPIHSHLTSVPTYQDPLTRLDEQARFVESALLACILMDPAVIHPVYDIVDACDFFLPAHAQAYRCMVGLMHRGTPPDIVSVRLGISLQSLPLSDVTDLSRMLVVAAENGVYPCYAQHYAEQVVDLANRRRLVRSAQEQVQRAYNPAPLDEAPPIPRFHLDQPNR